MDEHPRQKRLGQNRRLALFTLWILIFCTIPLCLFVLMSPPKLIVFWWAEDYDQDTKPSGKFQERDQSQNRAQFSSMPVKNENADAPKILLISYDAFRWDYIQRHNNTPTFRWLIANGVFATEGLKNTFITITAPNHYGIVTGLFEESHGIVANQFFGPELNETFNYFTDRQKTDPRFFTHGEPIWVANDRLPGRATGCQMWVGCDVSIKGHLPKHYVSWDGELSWNTRIDSIISWFKDPDGPINLALLYIEEPDETAHMYGPDDPHTHAMIEKMDQLTSFLLWRLYSEDLLDEVNLIFTADHGMASVPWANVVNLDQYVDPSWYKVYGGTPNWNVLPVPGKEQEIYDALYNKVPHLLVYNKTTIPEDYHYTDTPHVMPLQFVSEVHWRLAHNDTLVQNKADGGFEYRRETRGRTLTRKMEISNETVGEHGYNNSHPDMHPYFIAHGPAFKKGYNVTQFMNLDIYPLMCHILGVDPAPNNGSFDRVRSILKDNGTTAGMRYAADRNFLKFNELPPWISGADYEPKASTPRNFDIKVTKHYLPYTYSINFDVFVMTMLLCVYVAIMVLLADRVRGNRRQHCNDHSETKPMQNSTKGEKSAVIDIVA